jgi:hypothetical protein
VRTARTPRRSTARSLYWAAAERLVSCLVAMSPVRHRDVLRGGYVGDVCDVAMFGALLQSHVSVIRVHEKANTLTKRGTFASMKEGLVSVICVCLRACDRVRTRSTTPA